MGPLAAARAAWPQRRGGGLVARDRSPAWFGTCLGGFERAPVRMLAASPRIFDNTNLCTEPAGDALAWTYPRASGSVDEHDVLRDLGVVTPAVGSIVVARGFWQDNHHVQPLQSARRTSTSLRPRGPPESVSSSTGRVRKLLPQLRVRALVRGMARSWRARSLGLFNLNGILLRRFERPTASLRLGKQQLFFFFNPLGRGLNALARQDRGCTATLDRASPPSLEKRPSLSQSLRFPVRTGSPLHFAVLPSRHGGWFGLSISGRSGRFSRRHFEHSASEVPARSEMCLYAFTLSARE
jgi:hypothetical protein